MSQSQGDVNRPLLKHAWPRAWAPQVPGLAERLEAGARVADVACGHGWSAIGLASVYKEIEVDGFDVDPAAIEAARAHAEEAGVADRVRFHRVDAAAPLSGGPYDVITAFEAVHDLARPVEVLAAIRAAAAPDALVLVVDEAADPVFAPPGDEVQRLLYGFSLLICLPDSLSQAGSVGTGTVMRPETLAGYAAAAGFTGAEPLEVDDTGFWRFYRLGL
jgi:SAM-dependent methyltransferase